MKLIYLFLYLSIGNISATFLDYFYTLNNSEIELVKNYTILYPNEYQIISILI